jgi:hypothetical protein
MCFDPTRPHKKFHISDGSKEKCIDSNWSFVRKNVYSPFEIKVGESNQANCSRIEFSFDT